MGSEPSESPNWPYITHLANCRNRNSPIDSSDESIKEGVKKWAGSSKVPAAFALFPADISRPPREWAERFFNVQRWTEMPRGGHFAAMEEPALLAEDIRAWFRPFRA